MLNVNDMFPDVITKITNSLIPPGFEGDVRSIRDYNVSYRLAQESVARAVDALGAQSAAAQGLSKVITTADKLRTAADHTLYLYKDASAQQGKGEVVGLLKVGRKHLFLADESARVLELEPLCVLDFFVLPACQRAGVGRQLFDHMLQDQGTAVHRLAVDGPSQSMAAFLRRQYGVPRLLHQNNNFAVAPAFFDDLEPGHRPADAHSAPAGAGRYSAPKPHSSIANVIHGSGGSYASGEESAASRSPASPPPPAALAAPAPPAAPAGQSSSPPRPRTLPVSAAPPPPAPATPTPAGAPSRRDSQHTDKGFFDVKFYHKKLW